MLRLTCAIDGGAIDPVAQRRGPDGPRGALRRLSRSTTASMSGPEAAGVSGREAAVPTSVPCGAALGASPVASVPKASSSWIFCRLAITRSPVLLPPPTFRPSAGRGRPTMPSADFCPAITRLAAGSAPRSGHGADLPRQARPPSPHTRRIYCPRPLIAVDFAVIRPLVRPGQPPIRFLSIGSRLCSALPSDPTSRWRPCASLTLRRYQTR